MSVTCRLYGRMGNQMFQMAAAAAYAKRHQLDVFFPTDTVAPRVFPYYFRNLGGFTYRSKVPAFYNVHKEKGHGYSEIPYIPNVVLDGYFQSAKYFDDQRPHVLKLFNLPWSPLEGFIGVHVRRGDYLQFPDKHPPVDYDYLREAIMYFHDMGYRSAVVCSDDIPWCRQTLRGLEVYGWEFSYSQGNTAQQDVALLACCEHQVVSNSTFSWWAHYLNQNPEKQAIAPKNWFGPGNAHLDTQDIYLPTMKQI